LSRLIVGLGNVGLKYEKTRHNAGFMILEALAEKVKIKFKEESRFKGKIAVGIIENDPVILLKPSTYINLSGQSVQKICDFYKIQTQDVLVVTDDIALPFGQLRIKNSGSSGGHNGLLSIQMSLNSTNFPRLRVGVGDRVIGPLEDYVLSRFTEEEFRRFEKVKDRCQEAILLWLKVGVDRAMNQVNKKYDPVVGEEI
jgi:PTH1 family peptidyl-tRNA hydrolase